MAKRRDKQAVIIVGFNYDKLEPAARDVAKASAERIKAKVRKAVEDIIDVGNELLSVKEALEHGQFLKWLKGEFGWSERMARNFMAVAQHFGKSANFADLTIQPSAAYLLAAPAVPDEARQTAIAKAEAGEEITFSAAKKMVAEAKKKKRPRRRKAVPIDKLTARLATVLEHYQERWDPKDLPQLARQLREFADSVDGQKGGKKTK
jgi:hypothetical protein